jgi:hypothetical protein
MDPLIAFNCAILIGASGAITPALGVVYKWWGKVIESWARLRVFPLLLGLLVVGSYSTVCFLQVLFDCSKLGA